MKNKIILSADTKLQDNELREWVSKIQTQVETLNERAKRQTIQIDELRKLVNKLKVARE